MANKYLHAKICKRVADETPLVYVGSTKLPLNVRFQGHKSAYREGRNISSREIVHYRSARIELIKSVPARTNRSCSRLSAIILNSFTA